MSCNCHHRENIDHVHQMLTDDKWMTINQIANAISIYDEGFQNIQQNEIDMVIISA